MERDGKMLWSGRDFQAQSDLMPPQDPMVSDVLVALVDRDQLSTILPVVHRHMLGHVSRVLNPERGDLTSQLRRAGVPVEQAPALVTDAPLLLLISAAGKCPAAAHMLMQAGIHHFWIVRKTGVWSDVDDSVDVLKPAVAAPIGRMPHIPVPGMRDPAVDRPRDPVFQSDGPSSIESAGEPPA